ncbi:lipopolysaccharide biosynthesis protein [Actinotalea sp. K2]|uniref:lipopolysaccharide biosynthesis protein n=1 Tax=Actinotalea sp. K2 TaxID=2939438 RepID=UPI0020180F76|nr:lipopolysaccharide biosynthesis protein [Actinotalea sp. K2]MCL3861281.1 lipopolysaccharide biosynthesis protein [Actinotalea sp. K2]
MRRPRGRSDRTPAPARAPLGLGHHAARGAFVTLGGQGLRIVIQVLSVALLARVLSPQDYGLIAMVVVIVGVGEIFRDFGLSSAAIQAPTLSREQRDNLFWINTGIGLTLGAVVFVAAGAVAALYDQPELVGIARLLSVTFLLNGIATQYRADLVRHLRFGALAMADVLAPVIALGVAMAFAVAGFGYWALVAQTLAQTTTLLIAYAVSARWFPRLPHRGVEMRGLLRFGWRLVGTQLIGYASNNVDSFVIGLRFGAGSLGLYNRAFHLLMTPLNQLRAPTTTVALPVLSRLQDDDLRYAEFIRRGQLALGYTLVAALGVVATAAEPIVEIFLGPRWETVVPLLRLLAVAGIFQTLSYVGYWIYLSRNLTGDLLRYTMVTAAIKVVCILVGSTWGVIGVAAGYAVAPALAWPLSLWWLSRRTVIPTRALMTGALRILAVVACAAGVAAVVDLTLVAHPAPLRLAVTAVTTVAVYALGGLVLPPLRRDISGVLAIARLGASRGALL